MKDEYIIINKSQIEKRIEELEWSLNNIPESYVPKHEAQIYALKQILSQSTPLIPEIENAFSAGIDFTGIGNFRKGTKEYESYIDRKTYITNLKLDI